MNVSRTFHPSVFIAMELQSRLWGKDDLALRMGGDYGTNRLALDLYENAGPDTTKMFFGDNLWRKLAMAFGHDAQHWIKLEEMWRDMFRIESSAGRVGGGYQPSGSVAQPPKIVKNQPSSVATPVSAK